MKNLVENVIEGKEKTAESTISPVGEVEGQVAEILGLDWTPLVNEKLEAHAEEILPSGREKQVRNHVLTAKCPNSALRCPQNALAGSIAM